MSAIRTFRDLLAWQAAMDVVELTYQLTAGLPDSERYGLSSQMRRASVSIPSNIAEGQAVEAPRWSLRHIVTAIGSAAELATQIEVAVRLRFVPAPAARVLGERLLDTQRLLYGLRRERRLRIGAAMATAFVILLATTAALLS